MAGTAIGRRRNCAVNVPVSSGSPVVGCALLIRGVAQLGRAPALGAGDRRFKSCHPDHAELPRLTSHGLRRTAATHMVHQSKDLGELRAIADILGHSPEILMNTYAHALPTSQLAVVEWIGRR